MSIERAEKIFLKFKEELANVSPNPNQNDFNGYILGLISALTIEIQDLKNPTLTVKAKAIRPPHLFKVGDVVRSGNCCPFKIDQINDFGNRYEYQSDDESQGCVLEERLTLVEAAPSPTPKVPNKNPMQPLVIKDGVVRFKANEVVRYLLDKGGLTLNDLALQDFSQDDEEQFAQLIGYSVCGFGDLSYVSEETYNKATELGEKLCPTK